MLLVRRTSAAIAVAAAMAQITACGGGPAQGPAAPKPKPPVAQAEPGAPEGEVDRRTLDLVLLEGPTWVLERVPIEEVMEKGKFVGWRIQELPAQWSVVDLQPGDVVTAVNDQRVEKPNDFWAAWTTLSTAKEIKIAYRRYGEPGELTVPIWGEPDPSITKRLDGKRPPPRQSKPIGSAGDGDPGPAGIPPAGASKGPKRKPTIVIRPPKPPPGNDW